MTQDRITQIIGNPDIYRVKANDPALLKSMRELLDDNPQADLNVRLGVLETNSFTDHPPALFWAIRYGHKDLVRLLIDRGADRNFNYWGPQGTDFWGDHNHLGKPSKTSLGTFIYKVDDGFMRSHKVELMRKCTTLLCALMHHQGDIAHMLVDEYGVKPTDKELTDFLFDAAVRHKDEEGTRLALEFGAPLDRKDTSNCPLHRTDSSRIKKQLTAALKKLDADLFIVIESQPPGDPNTLIWVKNLVKRGADINACIQVNEEKPAKSTNKAMPFLLQALKTGHADVAVWLIENNADISVTDANGMGVWQYAEIFPNDFDKVAAALDKREPSGGTPRRQVITRANIETTELPISQNNLPSPVTLDRMLTAVKLRETKGEGGQTNLQILGEQGRLRDVFTPAIWSGRSEEMEEAWASVPAQHQDQVDIAAVRTDLATQAGVRERFNARPGGGRWKKGF